MGGGKGGVNPRVVITPCLPLPPYWGRIILDVQGHPPLAEGLRGFPLERQEIVAFPEKMAGTVRGGGSLLSLRWGIAPHGLR